MSHNFSTLLTTLREKIPSLEACTAVCMLLSIMRDKTCLSPIVYLFSSMLTSEFILGTKQKDHLHPYNTAFPGGNSNSVGFSSLEDKTSLDSWQWPSYKPRDNSDSTKLSETWCLFLPVIAVQVVQLLVQSGMALLLSFHPHSFLPHLLPPELLATLPKVKVTANKRLFLKIFSVLKIHK